MQHILIYSHNSYLNETAASIFGEQKRLEPMPAERKAKWRKEIDWLLSVTDYVVEMVPSQQKSKDGSNMEVALFLFKYLCYSSYHNNCYMIEPDFYIE